MKSYILSFIIIAICATDTNAQNYDSIFIKKIFNEALENGHAYRRLGQLCKTIGPRLSGSENAAKGIVWAESMLKSYHFDSVFLQPVMVPCWQRGDSEELYFKAPIFNEQLLENKRNNVFKSSYDCEAYFEQELDPNLEWFPAKGIALGGSVGTNGLMMGELQIVYSDEEVKTLGEQGKLKGKIVLFNKHFDEKLLNTFSAYGSCVGQRVSGASLAAKYGAVGVLVRSMSNRCDMHAHTGVMIYKDSVNQIPAMAIPTAVADELEILNFAQKPNPVLIRMKLKCRTLPDQPSHNVIAETKGKEFPGRYIAFGGHFDSWDQGEGAHDDGAGCMHAFEALRILRELGYQPRHTLRCVFFMNEENGLRGATEYAKQAFEKKEFHVAGIESDRGGFTPRGFSLEADTIIKERILFYKKMLAMYGITDFVNGSAGADINPLKKGNNILNPKMVLVGFIPDSQRYFDVHHAETDVFENVNKRELHLGAASMAAMIYILDQVLD